MKRGGRGSDDQGPVTGVQLRGDQPLPLRGKGRAEKQDSWQHQPPGPARVPSDGIPGDARIQQLAARHDAVLAAGSAEGFGSKGHGLMLARTDCVQEVVVAACG